MAKGHSRMPLRQRLMKMIKIDPETNCWVWQGALASKGHGRLTLNWRNMKAHRFAYMLLKGSIPKGLFVCHHCDNPPCCNPDHLFLGTNKDNMQDASRKGRLVRPKRKLNASNIEEILQLRSSGSKQKEVAEKYNISRSFVSMIESGKRYGKRN